MQIGGFFLGAKSERGKQIGVCCQGYEKTRGSLGKRKTNSRSNMQYNDGAYQALEKKERV